MNPIFVQMVGFAGLACFLISYQIKSNKALYATQCAGNALFMVQFLLLGAYSGSANLVLGIIRNLMMTQYHKYSWIRWKGWVVIFCLGYAAVVAFTWNGLHSLLPFAAMSACTIAFWTDNALNIRKANLFVACPSWIAYDIIVHSIAGVLSESFTITSILISIWRFGWNNLGSDDSGF